MTASASPTSPWTTATKVSFGLLVGAVLFSLSGTLLLQLFPTLAGTFGPYFAQLVKAPTWTYMTLLPIVVIAMYAPDMGLGRVMGAFVIGTVIGGASELLGTTSGLPFGEYAYTAWLGPKIADHVPYFIPPSWFAMSLVCWELANRLSRTVWARVLIGALLMVAWDVSLDPAMSRAFPFWTYPNGGFFFGMPLSNWFGWFGVSALIVGAYELLLRRPPNPHPWALAYFVVNCAFPFLLSALYGLAPATVYGVIVTGLVVFIVRTRSRDVSA